jgi:hypothetical protein
VSSEWVEEGLRQLRLATAWRGYAALLASAGAPESLTEPLRGLAESFLRQAWLPGVAEAVEDLCTSPEARSERFVSNDGPAATAAWVSRTSPDPEAGTEPAALRCWLRGCARKARQGPPAAEAEEAPPRAAREVAGWPGPTPKERVGFWAAQALILRSWRVGAEERAKARRFAGGREKWSALRDDCSDHEGRLEESRQRGWSLFGRQRHTDLLDETADLIRRCRSTIDDVLDVVPAGPVEALLGRLEAAITTLLDGTPPSWPPLRLVRLEGDIGRPAGAGFLERLADVSTGAPPAWLTDAALSRDLGRDPRARILLVRLIIEVLGGSGPAPLWQAVGGALGDLLAPSGIRPELVSDFQPSSPPAWFDLVEDPAVDRPRLERAGLVVQVADGEWTCFPLAGLRVPPPGEVLRRIGARLGETGPREALVGLCRDLLATVGAAVPERGWGGMEGALRDGFWRMLPHLSPAPTPSESPAASAEDDGAGRTAAPVRSRWAELPPPPQFAAPAESLTAPPLVRWHAEAMREAGRYQGERAAAARRIFQDWLATTGGDWFDRLARAAHEGGEAGGSARAWLAALLAEEWCRPYPSVDPASGALEWPADTPRPQEIGWEFDPSSPGSVLSVERFAPVPVGARFVLSQGPRHADAALDAAVRLQEEVAALETGRDLLLGPAGRLLRQTREQLLTGQPGAAPDGLLAEVLDTLAQAAQPVGTGAEPAPGARAVPREAVRRTDRVLSELRCWGQAVGLEILPRSWSFARPPRREQLAPEEFAGASLIFRPNDTKGSVFRVRNFGIARGGSVMRGCIVSVSVGPAPAGFAELEGLVREASHPTETALQQRLRGWREAALNGTLDVVAVQLYVDFWGSLGDPLRQQVPERAARIAEGLAIVLGKGLGLRTFNPARYQDYAPGWLELASDRGVVSGRVRRVLRPGLQDDEGRLRVPAVVEVE